MKYLFFILTLGLSTTSAQTIDLDAELLREFNEFIKSDMAELTNEKIPTVATTPSLLSSDFEGVSLESEDNLDLKREPIQKNKPLPVTKPKRKNETISTKKNTDSIVANAKKKAIPSFKNKKNTKVLSASVQSELDLINNKIEMIELEHKNKTIDQKKRVFSRPIEYETYKTIRKIPLSEIRNQDDILKHEDEIIEINFNNLTAREP